MGIDRPDDDSPALRESSRRTGADEIPVDEDAEIDGPRTSDESRQPGANFTDDIERARFHAEYRATVDAEYREAAAHAHWEKAKPEFDAEWARHAREGPATCGDSRASVSQTIRDSVEQGRWKTRETEENFVTPTLVRVEAVDPERKLVGLEHRCKGEDRMMEKVAHDVEYKGRTPDEALANMKDAIRYTFQYTEARYTAGVDADVDRLKAAGFELVELRNSWGREEYKGINSWWRLPDNGQLFEVQFHTRLSFEAKQLTHPAYERLRSASTSKAEQDELRDFQRRVTACISVPSGARDYPDYP